MTHIASSHLRAHVIRVPEDFDTLLRRQKAPLVVYATGGLLRTNHRDLTSYKALAFFTKAAAPVELPADAEPIAARSIWVLCFSAADLQRFSRHKYGWAFFRFEVGFSVVWG